STPDPTPAADEATPPTAQPTATQTDKPTDQPEQATQSTASKPTEEPEQATQSTAPKPTEEPEQTTQTTEQPAAEDDTDDYGGEYQILKSGSSGAKPVVAPLINQLPDTEQPKAEKKKTRARKTPVKKKFTPPSGAISIVRSAPNIGTDSGIPALAKIPIDIGGTRTQRVKKATIALFIDIDNTNMTKDNLEELFYSITARQQIIFVRIYGYGEDKTEYDDIIEKYNIHTVGKLISKTTMGNLVDFRVVLDAYECAIKNQKVVDTIFVWTAPCELSYVFEKINELGVATSTIDNPAFDCDNKWTTTKVKLFSYYDPTLVYYAPMQDQAYYGQQPIYEQTQAYMEQPMPEQIYMGQPVYEQQPIYTQPMGEQLYGQPSAYDQPPAQSVYDQPPMPEQFYGQQPAYVPPYIPPYIPPYAPPTPMSPQEQFVAPLPAQDYGQRPTYEPPSVPEEPREQFVAPLPAQTYEQPKAHSPIPKQPEKPKEHSPIPKQPEKQSETHFSDTVRGDNGNETKYDKPNDSKTTDSGTGADTDTYADTYPYGGGNPKTDYAQTDHTKMSHEKDDQTYNNQTFGVQSESKNDSENEMDKKTDYTQTYHEEDDQTDDAQTDYETGYKRNEDDDEIITDSEDEENGQDTQTNYAQTDDDTVDRMNALRQDTQTNYAQTDEEDEETDYAQTDDEDEETDYAQTDDEEDEADEQMYGEEDENEDGNDSEEQIADDQTNEEDAGEQTTTTSRKKKKDDDDIPSEEVSMNMSYGFGNEADMDVKIPETEEDNRLMVMDMMKEMGFDFEQGSGGGESEIYGAEESGPGNLDDI
ncbi:MAG: NYN domain-containing protein, partial [Christensenellaceae bacterium]|nr:NYN domain-containing protein [Christensenellaceae bacterium]